MVLPMVTSHKPKSSLFMAAEFIIAFVELLLDAIPGVVLSISNTVLDGVSRVSVASAAWSGSALADQHFSGNLLWMIAEGADLPILIMLMMRWRRSDRAEARKADELTDEEYEILVQQHLRVGRSDG
jgi:putative membrane protein